MLNPCRFGRFEVRPVERQLLVEGQAVELGARAFNLLMCLIEQPHRTVTKAELLERVWPGLVVEENNLSVQVSTLRKHLGPKVIVTIPAQGYRFAMALDGPSQTSDVAHGSANPTQDKPTIAVLPFRVLSNENRTGFLAAGLAEDVMALLARVPGFLVISRASSIEFEGSSASLAEIATQLGVRYVVEGSVRLVADRVRVYAGLTDSMTGCLLWSRQFESDHQDTEDLQDGITRGIMSELEPELTRAEIELIHRQRPENVDAWGHYRQAIGAIALRGWREDAVGDAISQLQQAVAADPNFGLAYAHTALLQALAFSTGLITKSEGLESEALAAAEHAIVLDEGSSVVLGYAGCALCDLGHTERGVEILRQALELDPSNAQAHVALGASLAMCGQTVTGIDAMRFGMRISPKDRRRGFWGWALGSFLLRAGHTEAALQEARTASASDRKLYLARVLEAAALQALGRPGEARTALMAARQLRAALTLAEVARSHGGSVAKALTPLWSKD